VVQQFCYKGGKLCIIFRFSFNGPAVDKRLKNKYKRDKNLFVRDCLRKYHC
jgi:hypothetical protein